MRSHSPTCTTFIKRNSHSMAIMPILQNEVVSIVKNWKWVVLGGIHISAFVVKAPYPYFGYYTESICYAWCFFIGVETEQSNSVIQGNNPMWFSTFRPVFVLSVFHQLFESFVCKLLSSLIKKHKSLYFYWFGFSINDTQNFGLVDEISDAFNTVNHEILFAKL